MTELDELLEPTLGSADDDAGFDRPFNPRSLVIASFFGGALAAAWLFAWNFRKLGEPRKAPWCFAALTLVGVAVVAAIAYYVQTSPDLDAFKDQTRTLKLVSRVAGVVVGLAMAGMQERRFRLYSMGGGEPAPALLPSLIAILITTLLQILVIGPMVLERTP